MDSNQLKVEYAPGNEDGLKWCIVGGGLPRGACWDAFATREQATREAQSLADEMGCELVQS